MRSAPLLLVFVLAVVALLVALGGWILRSRRQRRQMIYQGQLERAVADGVLTPEEVRHLEQLRSDGALSDGEVRMAALAVYRRALGAVMADARVTPEEDATLHKMQDLLGLSERDLAGDAAHVRRMRLLAQIERGELPEVDAPFDLPVGEAGHWTVQATLCERIAYTGLPPAEPPHLLFETLGEEPFSAAGSRENLSTTSSVMPVDLGVLVVSNRTLRFRGAKTEVIAPLARLRRIALFRDGIRIDLADPIASRYFLASDPELTAAVLLLSARRVGAAGSSGRATH